MNIPDAKLAAWIKSLGAAKETSSTDRMVEAEASLLHGFANPEVSSAVASVIRLAIRPPSDRWPEECLHQLRKLQSAHFPKSAAAFAVLANDALLKLPPLDVGSSLPDAATIERWRKSAKLPIPELAHLFLCNLSVAFENAGGDWLLTHSAPDALLSALAFLLDQISGGNRGDKATARIQAYLLKDTKGCHLAGLLKATDGHPLRLSVLAAAIRTSSEVLAGISDTLPLLCRPKAPPLPLGTLLREIFSLAADSKGKTRMKTCGALARLGAGVLLLDTRSEVADEVLLAVAEIGNSLRDLSREPNLVRSTWVLAPIGQPTALDLQMITPEGARRWAFAYEETERAGWPLASLETLGLNLGLRHIAEVGCRFAFQPQRHQDIDGGLLPGDPAIAVTTGWALNNQPLIRARVRPTPLS